VGALTDSRRGSAMTRAGSLTPPVPTRMGGRIVSEAAETKFLLRSWMLGELSPAEAMTVSNREAAKHRTVSLTPPDPALTGGSG
jgi:hypothetical protein